MKTLKQRLSESGGQQLMKPSGVPPQASRLPGVESREKPSDSRSPDDLWKQWKASGDPGDYRKTVASLEPAVNRAVAAFAEGRDELKPRARILAAEAVRKYNPDVKGSGGRQASLETWTHSHLRRLQRVAADRREAVRIPERSRMDAIMLRDATTEFSNIHGYEPDIVTLSERTGLSKSRIKLASRAFRELSAAGLETEKGDTLLQQEPEYADDPWVDYVYHDLDDKNRKIFEWTTGYGGSRTLPKSEIAKRLKITPAAVSSRINTIVGRLEERPGGDVP